MAAHARRVVSGVAKRGSGAEHVSAAKRDSAVRRGRVRHRKARNSSIELLRIIAMLMIVTSHCVLYTDLNVLTMRFGVNKVLIETFLYSGGKIGVVAFFAISAWFLSDKGGVRAGFRRVWILEREILFWSLTLFAIAVVSDRSQMTASLGVRSLLPVITALWWYPTAYAVFLLMFPFVAKGLRSFGEQMHRTLCILMFVLWTALDMLMPLSGVGLPGGNWLSFVYIYTLISFYKWYMRPLRRATAWWMLLVGYGLLAAEAVAGGVLFARTGKLGVLQVYLSRAEFRLPVLMIGFALFVLAERRTFHSGLINAVAASTFGVYLISEYPFMRSRIWGSQWIDFSRLTGAADSGDAAGATGAAGSPLLIVAIIGASIAVFAVCAVFDQIRELLFRLTIDRNRGKWFDALWNGVGGLKAMRNDIDDTGAKDMMRSDSDRNDLNMARNGRMR